MQSSDVLIDLAIIAALWLMARYVLYLFRLLQKENTERRATGRGHTWKDTGAILVFVGVLWVLAAKGATDRDILRLVMFAIAVYFGVRAYRDHKRVQAERGKRDNRAYRPYTDI